MAHKVLPYSTALLLGWIFGGMLLVFTPPSQAQESLAHFDAPVIIADKFHRIERLPDLDGDGYPDAIGTWPNIDDQIFLTGWINDGQGELVRSWNRLVGDDTLLSFLELADLNADGKDDFVFANGTEITLYLGNGNQRALRSHRITEPDSVGALAPADFDGDGLDDIAIVTGRNELKIFTNRSSDAPELTSTTPSFSAEALHIFDTDGDGLPDLLSCSSAGNFTWIRTFLVDGSQPVVQTAQFQIAYFDPAVVTGDIDGDGDEDVVLFDEGDGEYIVLRRTSPSILEQEDRVFGGPATDLVDIDLDGDLDGVCCGGGGGDPPSPPQNDDASVFMVATNDGDGNFAEAFDILGLGAERLAGAVDLDRDGDIDLVAGRVAYYTPRRLRNPYPEVRTAGGLAFPLDYDGDGDIDLDFKVQSGTVQRNQANGKYRTDNPMLPPAAPGTVFAGDEIPGDFDADGDIDFLVEQRDESSGDLISVRFLRNNGGRFVDSGAATDGDRFFGQYGGIRTVVRGDIENDGDLDFVARFDTRSPSQIWLNDGTGLFERGQTLSDSPVTHIIDLTGDEIPDLVENRDVDERFYDLRIGNGDGTFGPPQTLIQSGSSHGFMAPPAISDLDGDGDPDLAAFNTLGHPAFFANDGHGAFENRGEVMANYEENGAWWAHMKILATDVDTDGDDDLLVSAAQDKLNFITAILLNDGDANFSSPIFQIFSARLCVDVNGDGDPDLLSADYNRDPFSTAHRIVGDHFIRNRTRVTPGSGSLRQFGLGLSGSGGVTPCVGAAGTARPGLPFVLRITGALGGADAFLLSGTQRTTDPFHGGTLYLQPTKTRELSLLGIAEEPGAGTIRVSAPRIPNRVAGRTFFVQVLVEDEAGPEGYSLSNALEILVGTE